MGGAQTLVHQAFFFSLNSQVPPSLNSFPFRSDPLRRRPENGHWVGKFLFKLQGCSVWDNSPVGLENCQCNFLTCPEAPKVAKCWNPSSYACDLYNFFTAPMAREWRLPLASNAPVLPLAGLTWTAWWLIIPHVLNLGILFHSILSFSFFFPK
jgi:hypothetical protein